MLKIPSHLSVVLERQGTVIVPSRQRAHALRLAYAAEQLARGRRVWPSPDVLPLEGWLTREVERHAAAGHRVPRLLSAAEEWLLWRECTGEATAGLELVNRASLAQSLRRASGVAAQLGIDLRASREHPGTETALLIAVQGAVAQRCRALGAALLPEVLRTLPCIGDSRPVAFAGFLSSLPLLRAIAALRAQHGHETVQPLPGDAAGRGEPRVLRPADAMEELDRIAAWCCQRLRARADERVLIVLPGSAGRRERLATLIRQALDPPGWLATHTAQEQVDWVGEIDQASPVVIEGGQPLAGLPAVAHALASLMLLAGKPLEAARLTEWLRAPWWAQPEPAARARLDLWLRRCGRLQLDLPQLLALLRRAPAAIRAAATAIGTRLEQATQPLAAVSGTPREWSERFRAALEVLEWPGGAARRASAEQQTLLRFHELLDELGQLSAAARSMTGDLALQWLTELAAHTPYRPADDDAPVTICATYADPVVHYDALWVSGLDAESFPQPVAPDPFVPLAVQIAAGWPAASAAGRLQEARALIGAWRAAAAELVLSAPARAGDIEVLASPLLEEWRPTEAAVEERGPVWLAARLHRPRRLVEWRDDVGRAWDPGAPLPLGTRSLELQNHCPFRAYAELRLGSVELDMPEPGIAPEARGHLLHAVLQRLWERLGDSRALGAHSPQSLEELLSACIEEAASQLQPPDLEPPEGRALARERRRTARLVRKLLELERARAPFRVQRTEHGSRLRLGDQELNLRIDRLDALESGGVAILDYKSGRRVSADWYGERPSHPQLLAYLAAVGEGVVAMATVNVTAREIRFEGVSATDRLLPKVTAVKGPQGQSQDAWPARVREWRAVIERLASDFAAGRAPVDPMPRACTYCHVASVCRVGDEVVVDEGAEDGAPGVDEYD